MANQLQRLVRDRPEQPTTARPSRRASTEPALKVKTDVPRRRKRGLRLLERTA